MDYIPKAAITESNGEISCSIEETNRIRALLGLRPLQESKENKELDAVRNFKQKQDAEKKNRETEELRQRIEKAKYKRQLHEKIGGATLSTIENDEEDSALMSASEWVKRSRIKALESSNKPSIESKVDTETHNEYSEENLHGLKVMHSLNDLEVGEEVILTLTDNSVLKRDERGKIIGVNDQEDILENINMSEEESRVMREKQKKRLHQPIYAGYDDDEFDFMQGSKPSLLSHYDKVEKLGPKYVLGVGELNNRPSIVESTDNHRKVESLQIDYENNTNNDFYTQSEYEATFKKRNTEKTSKMKKRLKKRVEDPEEADLDSLLTGGVSVLQDAATDRGSRVKKPTEDVKDVKSITLTSKIESSGRINILLNDSENRLKRLTESKPTNMPIEDRGASKALEIINKIQSNGAIESKMSEDVSSTLDLDEIDAEGRRKDGTLIFSSTTEFTARLQALLNEKARSDAEKVMQTDDRPFKSRKLSTDYVGEIEEENIDRVQAVEAMDVDEEDEEDEDEENDEDVDKDGQLEFLHQQPLVARSTAAALSLLKNSGDLKVQNEQFGRAKDHRDEGNQSAAEREVKIEYRDEFGRSLTKKEAFRQLCYRFHGYGPAKKNKEKRMRKMELQKKTRTVLDVGTSMTMKSLEKAQHATGKAHITIQGGVSSSSNQVSLSQLAAQLIEKAKKKKEAKQKKSKKKE